MTYPRRAFNPQPPPCIQCPALYYLVRHICRWGGALTRFFCPFVMLGRDVGFLIAKSRFECRGRERERR